MWKCSKVVRIAGYRNKMKGAWLSVGGGLYVSGKEKYFVSAIKAGKLCITFPPGGQRKKGKGTESARLVGWAPYLQRTKSV